jgi:GNAT superfamily N-acetyltransferase
MTPAPQETELRVSTLTLDLAGQCAALERLVFPHANPADLLGEADIRAYAKTFPEGFFVVMDGDRVVGQGAGIFLDFDFSHPQHTIAEITGEHQCANHDPDGEWYYGTDIAVHPQYRRRGIGRRLYQLRKDLVRRSNKRGIIAGAHIPGYADHKRTMSAEDYAAKVAAGVLYDPTLSFQLDNGFQIKGMLENYLRDDSTDSWSVLIVWDNPSFEPPGKK